MQSGRYDFIAAPTTVTKERAENMLFSAGYLWTAYNKGHALRDAVQCRPPPSSGGRVYAVASSACR